MSTVRSLLVLSTLLAVPGFLILFATNFWLGIAVALIALSNLLGAGYLVGCVLYGER